MSERPFLPRVTLVLGGARSGKSGHAESLIGTACAAGCYRGATYVATAEALDAEMAARIAEHRRRRGDLWSTVEAPRDLVPALTAHADPKRPMLVDCLTLWLSNIIGDSHDADSEISALVDGLRNLAGPVVLVANEVGLGIVPDNALARTFRDRAGRLNQRVAELADRVLFVAAGLPLVLKDRDRDKE
ncbi:MAG: bifunctional adenosylcobinamide kinase/adenosylcobinamide-phosphate guanylyltransferase [Rhodospirillales bacterium]|nr:MAG: bifunctional adenosylcobinamide kinase/adenosylcobinamide-phosphate guanylyltransferase [Rhodospirillales bacterium]